MRRLPLDTFDRPWLILCEGESDKRFLDRLLEARIPLLRDQFHVQFPDRKGARGGRTLFGNYLANVLATSASFQANVQAVLIVSDNDDDPAQSWKEVAIELDKAKFPIPAAERVATKPKRGFPQVVVLMWPDKQQLGNLETVCADAIHAKWGIKRSIDAFMNATPAHGWTVGKQSKMRLHATVAATCATAPEATFAAQWDEAPQYHVISIDHPSFNWIEAFLAGFGVLLKAD
jgi:hypothetical protein